MGITGIWQWVIILAVVLILFARPGKISGIMSEFGKRLSKSKNGMKDANSGDADGQVEDVDTIEAEVTPAPAKKTAAKKKKAKKAAGNSASARKKTAAKKTATKKAAKKARA